jgi:phosphate transport system permease protein
LRAITYGAALTALSILLSLIGYIVIKGAPHLRFSLFSMRYTSKNVSLFPALIATIEITIITLAISAPLGVFTAIYLSEYAKRDSKFVRFIRIATETLTGIPSIIFALFGRIFFVSRLGWGFSVLSGAFTLAVMTLPIIVRTTEEAIKTVPKSYVEGALGLGASKVRTIFKITIPAASSGIFAGIILSIGRIVGETAALMYTAGTAPQIPRGRAFLMMSARTLAVHMYSLSSEGLHIPEAYASALILLILVLIINHFSTSWAKKIAGK